MVMPDGGVADGSGITILTPGACHTAHFMAKGIYTIRLTLFQHQLDFLGQEEKKKVNRLAKFISLSYVQWFLMSSLSVKAPSEDTLCLKNVITVVLTNRRHIIEIYERDI